MYTYVVFLTSGFRQKVPRKVHVNTASKEEKEDFKKRSPRYLWVNNYNKKKILT